MKIKDLARIAGVSPSTVSKIMHQKDDNISAETREHVLSIAKQYNYVPAQSLTSPDVKTMTLGVILKTLKIPAPFPGRIFCNGLRERKLCRKRVPEYPPDDLRPGRWSVVGTGSSRC